MYLLQLYLLLDEPLEEPTTPETDLLLDRLLEFASLSKNIKTGMSTNACIKFNIVCCIFHRDMKSEIRSSNWKNCLRSSE